MGWFGRQRSYDRTRLLDQAARARRRGRRKRAIALYRQVLAVKPDDPQVHRKIAPLLAQTRQHDDAWKSYRFVAAGLARQGFVDQAIGIYREAIGYLARDRRVWLALADLEVERGRRIDAANALLEGSRHLRSRRTRQEALDLLVRAREIEPGAFEPCFELGGLLARYGSKHKARRILEDLVPRARGRQLRRLRGRLFRMSPTPAAAWRWLAAAARG